MRRLAFRGSALASIVVAGLASVVLGPTQAANAVADCGQPPLAQDVNRVYGAMYANHASTAQIQAVLRQKFGLRPATVLRTIHTVRPNTSTRSQVTMGTPTIYTDSGCGGSGYYVVAGWTWKTLTGVATETGAFWDGAAISFTQSVRQTGYSLGYSGQSDWNPIVLPNPAAHNVYGSGFKWSPVFQKSPQNYQSYTGTMTISFDRQGLGACEDVFASFDYSHGWTTDKITGFSISTTSLSINRASEDPEWQTYSPDGNVVLVC